MRQYIKNLIYKYIIRKCNKSESICELKKDKKLEMKISKMNKPCMDWKLIFILLFLIIIGIFIEYEKIQTNLILDTEKFVNSFHRVWHILLGFIFFIFMYLLDYKKIRKHSLGIYIIATCIMLLPIILKKIGMSGICLNINGIYFLKLRFISFPITAIALPLYVISFVGFILDSKKGEIKVLKINIKKLKIHIMIKIRKKIIKDVVLSIISLVFMIIDLSFTNMIILLITYIIISIIKVRRDKDDKIFKLGTLYSFILGLICLCIAIVFLQQSIEWGELSKFINAKVEYSENNSDMVLQREILRKSKLIGEAENLSVPIDQTVFKTESNYTFIYIIGKFGLLMGELIVSIIVFISLRIIFNAKKITELYGRYLTIGLGSVYILQSFVTMFINISLGIYADVNIPFVTYGRVYFIINMFEIALLLSIYRRKNIDKLEKEQIENNELENKIEEKILIQK